MVDGNSRPKCYDCIHRGEVPGSAHSCCEHPATAQTRRSPFMQLAGAVGKRGGDELAAMASAFGEGPSRAAAQLHIEAAPRGVERGWFVWPVNFDPVWLIRCDGFTPKPATAADAANTTHGGEQ
jgi:hypothetical protein